MMEVGDLVSPKSVSHSWYGMVGWLVHDPGYDDKV